MKHFPVWVPASPGEFHALIAAVFAREKWYDSTSRRNAPVRKRTPASRRSLGQWKALREMEVACRDCDRRAVDAVAELVA